MRRRDLIKAAAGAAALDRHEVPGCGAIGVAAEGSDRQGDRAVAAGCRQ